MADSLGRARIPKGTRITGTFPEGEKIAGRTYTVQVKFLDRGWLPSTPWDGRHNYGVPDRVGWAGSGGYWHYADWEDIELLDLPLEVKVTRALVAAASGGS